MTVYGINLLWFNLGLNVVWAYALRNHLLSEEVDEATVGADLRLRR